MAEKSGGHAKQDCMEPDSKSFEMQLKALLQQAAMAYTHHSSSIILKADRDQKRSQQSLKVTISTLCGEKQGCKAMMS